MSLDDEINMLVTQLMLLDVKPDVPGICLCEMCTKAHLTGDKRYIIKELRNQLAVYTNLREGVLQ